jgi:5-methylcytosine-specific restriction endonuclease McrA
MINSWPKRRRIRLHHGHMHGFIGKFEGVVALSVLRGIAKLQVNHTMFRSQSGHDAEENLITLFARCHGEMHINSLT